MGWVLFDTLLKTFYDYIMEPNSSTDLKKLDLFEINKDVLQLYKKYFVYLLYFGIFATTISLFEPFSDDTLKFILSVILGFLTTAATVVILWFIDKNEQNQTISLGTAMNDALPYVLKYYLTETYVLVISLLAGVIFIVPGVILGIMYSQAALFVLFKQQSIRESLISSSQLTKGNRWIIFRIYAQLLILGLLYFGILAVIGSLSPIIGKPISLALHEIFSTASNIFLWYPIGIAFTYAIWRGLTAIQLTKDAPPADQATEESPQI
jgi:hypothetical protein